MLNAIINRFLPVAATFLPLAVGFSWHRMNFVKYGFKQTVLDTSIEKRFDDLGLSIDSLRTEIERELLWTSET